jgi:hypothetical protein
LLRDLWFIYNTYNKSQLEIIKQYISSKGRIKLKDNRSDTANTGTGESSDLLTNRQSHPVTDNQNIRTVGNRRPSTLKNYDFIEKNLSL